MATLGEFTASPATVPAGGKARIKVTFALEAGEQVDGKLYKDGAEVGAVSVTFSGETLPTVVAQGDTGEGWELRAPGGTLTPVGVNEFDLTA